MTATHELPESVRRLWGVPAQNDLPPFWDGAPVTWHGWKQIETTLDWHLPLDHVACEQCGGLGGGTLINPGTRPVDGTASRNIHAFRCPHCGRDTVWDMATDERWDLDPDDYGNEGSTETKEILF
jgi:hypothetical protein